MYQLRSGQELAAAADKPGSRRCAAAASRPKNSTAPRAARIGRPGPARVLHTRGHHKGPRGLTFAFHLVIRQKERKGKGQEKRERLGSKAGTPQGQTGGRGQRRQRTSRWLGQVPDQKQQQHEPHTQSVPLLQAKERLPTQIENNTASHMSATHGRTHTQHSVSERMQPGWGWTGRDTVDNGLEGRGGW